MQDDFHRVPSNEARWKSSCCAHPICAGYETACEFSFLKRGMDRRRDHGRSDHVGRGTYFLKTLATGITVGVCNRQICRKSLHTQRRRRRRLSLSEDP